MIRLYQEKDFNDCNFITSYHWAKEVPMSKNLQDFIYKFLVNYYVMNNDISFVYEDENKKVKAFALASYKYEKNNCMDYFTSSLNKLNEEEKKDALLYLDYLNFNHETVIELMDDNDVYFALFASIKKHAGSSLLENLISVCKQKNINNIFFWTDETCTYSYYEKKGFIKIKEYEVILYKRKLKTFVYKICLK